MTRLSPLIAAIGSLILAGSAPAAFVTIETSTPSPALPSGLFQINPPSGPGPNPVVLAFPTVLRSTRT